MDDKPVIVKVKKLPINYVDNVKLLEELRKYKGNPEKGLSNYVGRSILRIAEHLGTMPKFNGYCVDEKTEALTKRGWLTHEQIHTDDEILSYDIQTKKLVWSKIHSIYKNQYDGLMHKITNEGIDALVTPGHKFVCPKNGLITVEQIKAREHIVIMGDPENGNRIHKHDDEFVKLIGWFVTDGQITKGKNKHTIILWQKNCWKADLIRETLVKIGAHFSEHSCKNSDMLNFAITGEYAQKIHDNVLLSPKRSLSPKFILELTHEQRLILIDTMVKGDGWISNQTGGMRYAQKDKQHMDYFIMLCTLCGLTTSITEQKRETPFGYCEWYTVNIYLEPKKLCGTSQCDFYGGRPGPGGNLKNGKKPNIPTTPYSGIVWCPQTDYGTWVCRRGKYAYITGNSYLDEMKSDGVENVLMYIHNFDPEKYDNPFAYITKIVYYAFLRRIAKEKKQQYTKYKMTANYGIYNDIISGNADKNVEVFDNLNEFIGIYEDKKKEKDAKKIKKPSKKGLENYVESELDSE